MFYLLNKSFSPDFTWIESTNFETSVTIHSETYYLIPREMIDGRVEREKEVKETGGTKTGVYDLKSFAGIPYQSPDHDRFRVFPLKNV